MQRTPASHFSLRDVYRILFRHRRKATSFFLLVTIATVLYAVYAPRSYVSGGKLFVRLGRENVGLDPTATLGQGPVVAVPQFREDEINSVVDLLRSRAVVEKVVDEVGPAAILNEQSDEAVDFFAERVRREQAIMKFEKSLDISSVKKTNVIHIGYEARSAELAQQIVSKVMEHYLAEHVKMNRTPHAYQFLDEQTRRVKEDLVTKEAQLRDLQNQTGLSSPREQRDLLVRRISALREELASTQRTLQSSIAEARLMRRSLTGVDNIQVTARTNGLPLANVATEEVRRALYVLQLREKELLAKYTDQHYEVRQVQNQINSTRAMMSSLAGGIPSGDAADRGTESGAQAAAGQGWATGESPTELIQREPALAALDAKVISLREQVQAAERELQSFNESSLQVAKLQREIDLLDASYRKYASNLEQSRIDDSLQEERISNLSIVQPATINHKPVRPKQFIVLGIGIFVAIFGAAGIALGAEYIDHTFKTPEDLEQQLGLPTLATIPRFNPRFALFGSEN